MRFKAYRELSKSGIVALVLISVAAGYLIGHPFERPFDFGRLLVTLLGVLLLASGSSALNQLQERNLDATMKRTSGRPLPSGRLTPESAALFSGTCLTVGIALLLILGSALALLGVAAVISYNGFYTLWWKRRWAYGAVPGAVPGALPILIGYASASGRVFAPAGLYLFALLFFWQMPHFWTLALKYRDDYRKGGFPTLPVAMGAKVTVRQITVWCLAYVALAMIAPLFIRLGWVYLGPAAVVSAWVLWELRQFARHPEGNDGKSWLRFFLWVNFSLIAYLAAAAFDLWSIYLLVPWLTR